MGILVEGHCLDEIEHIIAQLENAAIYDFSTLSGPTALPEAAGVYAIFNKVTQEVYYVGKTTNLRQRLYNNHLMGALSNARLKKYLIEDPSFPVIVDRATAKEFIQKNCSFVYLLEPNMRLRGHLEGLLGFLTNCRYVDKEH